MMTPETLMPPADQLTPSQREEFEAARLRYAPLTMQVLTAVFLSETPVSPIELRDIVGAPRASISTALLRLCKGGMIERIGYAQYRTRPGLRRRTSQSFTLQCES